MRRTHKSKRIKIAYNMTQTIFGECKRCKKTLPLSAMRATYCPECSFVMKDKDFDFKSIFQKSGALAPSFDNLKYE